MLSEELAISGRWAAGINKPFGVNCAAEVDEVDDKEEATISCLEIVTALDEEEEEE